MVAERAEQVVERMREQLEPRWDAAREQRVWARLRSERAQPRRRVHAWGLALASAVLALLLVREWLRDMPAAPALDVVHLTDATARAMQPELRLADGSRLYASPQTRYVLDEVGDAAITIEVLAGKLELDVTHVPGRRFVVRAGEVRVEVIGTAFSVERAPEQVVVEVARGVVRVEAPDRAAVELERGARLALALATTQVPAATHLEPSTPAPAEPAPTLAPAPSPTPRVREPATSTSTSKRWRTHADAGEHDEAWTLLDAGGHVDRRDPEALMAAADVARLTRHPEQAIVWLAIVVDDHRDSSLAPLAAFTRGRLLLERLGDPAGAAAMFAEARALAPKGPLAEDALAREVEALAKAGEASKARERAEQFVEHFPAGSRRRAVEGWGGLD